MDHSNFIRIYNDEYSMLTYISTLKLDDNVARIYFNRHFGSICKGAYTGWIWEVGLAIGKKKEIANWMFGTAPTKLNDLPTFNKYGIKVLVWAKNAIQYFIDNYMDDNEVMAVDAADKKRERVYSKGLAKLGFKPMTVKYGYNYDYNYNYVGENEFVYSREMVYWHPENIED